jgi:hypothetical protein
MELLKKRRAKDLADTLNKPENYISNVKYRRKAIGEDLAREWEVKLGLPKYWFDGHDAVNEPPAKYTAYGVSVTRAGMLLAAEWENLDLDERIEVEQDIHSRVKKKKNAERAARKKQASTSA